MVLIFGDNFVRINEEQEHFGKIWVYVFICIFSFTLSVAPEISKNPKDATKKQGQEVIFSCSALGNPQPTFHWTKDGIRMNVKDNPRFNVSSTSVSHSLTIKDVGQSDVGKYRCVAENSVDSSVSSAATLTVACKVLVCRLIYDRYSFRLIHRLIHIIHSHVLLQTLNDPNFHCEISAALYFIPYLNFWPKRNSKGLNFTK